MTITFHTGNCDHPDCIWLTNTLFNGVGHIIGLDGHEVDNQCSTILMDKYRDNYFESLNRNRHRNYKKAKELYTFERFEYSNFVPDIVEINTSKDFRSGGPLKAHYKASVEERGGFPKSYKPIKESVCNRHERNIFHGIFQNIPGYKQGTVTTNKKLVAYNGIAVCEELAIYSWNIGHGEHLKNGVMTMLTIDTVNFLLNERPFVKYFVMGNWTDGLHVGPGLQEFKKEHMFEPVYLIRSYSTINCISVTL